MNTRYCTFLTQEKGVLSEDVELQGTRKACWSLQQRGALGETALHLCFLNNTPKLHIPIAHVLLEVYPAMALDMYEGEEFLWYVKHSYHTFTTVEGLWNM